MKETTAEETARILAAERTSWAVPIDQASAKPYHTCEWPGCAVDAVKSDKFGLRYCEEHAREAAPYTCGMKPIVEPTKETMTEDTKTKRISGCKSFWAALTPEQRSSEIKRRREVTFARLHAKAPAEALSLPQDQSEAVALVECTSGSIDALRGKTIDHTAHYNTGRIEPIAVIEDWGLGFCLGNALKYIARAPHKGTQLEDLRKARWYLDRHIAKLEGGGK